MKKRILKKQQQIYSKKNIFKSRKNIKQKKKDKQKIFPNKLKKICLICELIVVYIFSYKNKNPPPTPTIIKEKEISKEEINTNILPEIKSFEAKINLNQQIFYDFRKINSENKLLEENPNFEKSLNPDISVVMTMYNQAHCIYKGLRSVQNQSFKNIEIIIVDDCSEDNSTDVIKEYMKEDPRIILITHDSNESRMKARTDGIRKAKGKYITIIDGDDALIHKDILKNSLFIAQKANLDVVEFKGSGHRYGRPVNVVYQYNNEFENIIYQPELRNKFILKFGNNYELYNTIIWAKLIKNEVFQKALEYIGSEYVDDYSNENEDVVMALGVFHVAKSYYIMKEIGYYNSYDDKENVFPKTKLGKCKIKNIIKKFALIKFYKFLVEKNDNNDKEKNMVVNFLRKPGYPEILENKLNDTHYQIMFKVFDKILEWNCLTNEQRDFITQKKNDALKKKNNSN